MRNQKILVVVAFVLSTLSLGTSAAIINQVDFPEAFVQAKDKAVIVVAQEQVTAADLQK